MTTPTTLRRDLGLTGATLMGLGAMVGTGVFVSIGIGAGIAGPAVVLAIALAAIVAACNALSSAQLAASLPVTGGTYEYGHAYLTPWLGFTAGWMFLFAKSASAATAALGFAGYLLTAIGAEGILVPVALATAVAMTALVAAGIRRSNQANAVIVSITLVALVAFIVFGLSRVATLGSQPWVPFIDPAGGREAIPALLEATALMFVAFTGYARIATLGEEVHDPRRTIPRAVIATVAITAVLYIAVSVTGIATVGADALAEAVRTTAAPLEAAAQSFGIPGLPWLIAIGAITAMLGVLLNLLLGLSRMLLAMARRRDMPGTLAAISVAGSPVAAVIAAGAIVAGLTLIGSVKLTWSFSAFTVLVYYAVTNLAALRLPRDKRLYPPFVAWIGLAGCVFLAFWVEPIVWAAGLGLIAAGLVWHAVARRLAARASP
jgi:APA family basic amino acid/polyamine antiporter